MIIVGQDKRKIVNFDNIAHIFISKDSENHYLIEYGKMTGTSELLGIYATEERAKKVLQEIVKQYKNLITSYKKGRSDYPIETLMFNRNVYEMPVEKVDDK